MMLSIVIVNYNVEFFLEQCLNSVFSALNGIDAEVFVVDNNSIDGSVSLVEQRFPQVKLIANKENFGFSKANNQAIEISSGKYVLLLNPDTLVQEDTFQKVVKFMESHPDCGGLGVKMIDGKGNFLPESKRGLPTPMVAFYKIFGLARFFPKSKTFGKYHLSYLDKDQNHEIDVLSGAFMLLRKSVLDEIGLLDETFFMYGEDIDLSYRITLAGFKNYYLSDTQIIHYKGESTKKGSLNYVYVFYKAMVIFARKHFSGNNASLFAFIINTAIWFRASLAIVNRLVKLLWLPVVDIICSVGLLYLSSLGYQELSHKTLDKAIVQLAFPVFSGVLTLVLFFCSGYDRPFRFSKLFRSCIYGLILSLTIYSLLPEDWRFSRLMIVLGSASTLIYWLISRSFLRAAQIGIYTLRSDKMKRFVLVGLPDEVERLKSLTRSAYRGEAVFFEIGPNDVPKLNDLVRLEKIDEIIFSGKDLSAQQIITQMTEVESTWVDFKIAPPESEFIIGSNSIDSKGDFYLLEMSGIHNTVNVRNKRLVDLLLSLLFVLFAPLLFIFQKQRIKFLQNMVMCFIGETTWVGFNKEYSQTLRTNTLKKGIIPVGDRSDSKENIIKSNLIYSKDYSWYKDILTALNNLSDLGNKAV